MKACGEEVNIVLNCPHCPGGEPFTDQEALRKHIKWDHELQHLLYGEDEVAYLKKKLDHELQHALNGEEGVAGQKGELDNSTDSSKGTITTTRLKKKWKDITASMHIQGGN